MHILGAHARPVKFLCLFPSADGTAWANVCFRTMGQPLPRTATERYIVLIGERLNTLYDDIVQQELPSDIKAAIERLAAGLANKR
jgi:hypothetical protein